MASLRFTASIGLVGKPAPVRFCNSRVRPSIALQPARPTRKSGLAHGIPVSGPSSAAPAPEASGAPAGQISKELIEGMKSKIGEALETQSVQIQDVYGDGRHVSIDVVSQLFEGKSAVARQRMVYKAIWLELQEAVHAVDAMTTKTPQEASA